MASPSEFNWRSSGRHDNYRYMEAAPTIGEIKDLKEIHEIERGGSIKYHDLTTLKVSASLPFVGDFGIDNNYVRVYSISRNGDTDHSGYEETTLLHGTFLTSRPKTDYSGAVATGEIECYSLLKILEDLVIREPMTIDAGANPVTQAVSLVTKAKLSVIAEPSAMTLSNPRSYDAGTSYLEICNDLMKIAGFDTLEIDTTGTVRIQPYENPSSQHPRWILRDDDPDVWFGEKVTHDFDIFEVPNEVLVVLSAADEDPLTASAINSDQFSVYSTVSRGRMVTHVETVNDCKGSTTLEKQAILMETAKRILAEKSSAVESVEFEHPYLPYSCGDAIQLVYTKHGLDFTGITVSKELLLGSGMRCRTRIRRFVRR